MKSLFFRHQLRSLLVHSILLLSVSTALAQKNGDAFKIYSDLQKSYLLQTPHEVTPLGNSQVVTFGAEKEGSSSIITRIFGPDSDYFLKIHDQLSPEERLVFGKSFLEGLQSRKIVENNVVDVNGNVLNLDLSFLNNLNLNLITSDQQIRPLLVQFLELTNNQSFSFLKKSVRADLFNGTFKGLKKEINKCFRPYGRTGRGEGNLYSSHWNPLLGKAQKYLSRIEGMVWVQGWEFHLKPQNSYQEFEEALSWVKETLTKQVYTMTAPGHQRVVIPYPSNYNSSKQKIANLARMLQIYIVLEGVAGKTGIESAAAKNLQQDTDLITSLENAESTGRGVLRLEPGRFGESLGIEFRAGTKDPRVQRFIEQTAVSYISSGDYDSLQKLTTQNFDSTQQWNFSYKPKSNEEIASRFNLSLETVEAFQKNMNAVVMKRDDRAEHRYKKEILYLPLWSWESLPFLSKDKKERILLKGAEYIQKIAALPATEKRTAYRQYLSDWVKTTNLVTVFRTALAPKPAIGLPRIEHLVPEFAHIDLGLEETTQFPEKNVSRTHKDQNDMRVWDKTVYDMSPEEKSNYLNLVAKTLAINLGSKTKVYSNKSSGHGHGLDVQFQFMDAQNREWRVEWDGIGRSYNESTGEVLKETLRAGHIEIVTPKFQPTQKEMDAIYKTYEDLSIIPKINNGGGHINIDLKPFENNPKALSRFLLLFFKHRSIISSLFQAPERLGAAEAHEITENLYSQIKTEKLDELSLKKLLYNEGFFNQRFNRKTKYTQLDLSAYYQDVIPAEYKTADFDIKNPITEWKRNFDVNPNIRKMEFRLFNAPQTADDLKLQILLVRSLLKKAFSNESIDVNYYDTTFIDAKNYNLNPKKAFQDLKILSQDLGLPLDYYSDVLTSSMNRNRLIVESNHFANKVKNYNEHYQKMDFKKISESAVKIGLCKNLF